MPYVCRGCRFSFRWWTTHPRLIGRALGEVPWSALRLREAFAKYDAEHRFPLVIEAAHDNPACECGAILRGVKKPAECRLFGNGCTPDTPVGSCMVSAEGACAAHWTFGRFREHVSAARASPFPDPPPQAGEGRKASRRAVS